MGQVAAAAALTEPGTGADLRALTDELPGPDGPLPLLILDQQPLLAVHRAAEGAGPYFSALLGAGLTPVTMIPLSGPPAPAPEWRLELSAQRAARLTAPDGSIIWTGECGQPQPWRDLITRTGRCALLIGAIGLWAEHPPTRMETLLAQAAHAHQLVGGLVAASY